LDTVVVGMRIGDNAVERLEDFKSQLVCKIVKVFLPLRSAAKANFNVITQKIFGKNGENIVEKYKTVGKSKKLFYSHLQGTVDVGTNKTQSFKIAVDIIVGLVEIPEEATNGLSTVRVEVLGLEKSKPVKSNFSTKMPFCRWCNTGCISKRLTASEWKLFGKGHNF